MFQHPQHETVFHVQENGNTNLTPYHASEPSLPEHPSVSHFPDGLEIWSAPPNAASDICFIHGLMQDREKTWTAEGQSTPWPKALLPWQLQQCRILTYGYNVRSKSTGSSNLLIDHATNLLVDLASE
jgi:hypothetical protein